MAYKNHTYPDGTEYAGDWKENQRHGYGVWFRPDGMRYDGEWQNDRPHGRGTLTYPDGGKRIGIWEDGKFIRNIKEAQNEEIDNTVTVKKIDNKPYIYKNKSKYIGEWKDKKRHGYGVWVRPDGMMYEGEWQNDRPHGPGTLTYPDGTKRVGQWKDGKYVEELQSNGSRVMPTNELNIDDQKVAYETPDLKDQAAKGTEASYEKNINRSPEKKSCQADEANNIRNRPVPKRTIKWWQVAVLILVLLSATTALVFNMRLSSQRGTEDQLANQLSEFLNTDEYDSEAYQLIAELQPEAQNLSDQIQILIHNETSFKITKLTKDYALVEITSPKVDILFQETLDAFEVNYSTSFNQNRVALLNDIYSQLKQKELEYQTIAVEIEYLETDNKVEAVFNKAFFNALYGGLVDFSETNKMNFLNEVDNIE